MAPTRDGQSVWERRLLLGLTVAALVASGIAPYDRLTWAMEVSWVVVALPILIVTHRGFPLTPLLYRLLFIHALILILGGAYTYARVPLGFWFADLFGLTRNYYDRLGHLAQGFIPAILAREILVRRSPLQGSRWLPVVVVSICLAFSAFFELIEWWSALILGAVPGDAGRPLGHASGHVLRARRRHSRSRPARTRPRSAAEEDCRIAPQASVVAFSAPNREPVRRKMLYGAILLSATLRKRKSRNTWMRLELRSSSG